jgi:hypothetical protein
MKVPEGRPTIARRFNGGFRSLKPIESRRDERKHAFVRTISAAPAGLYPFVLKPTVKTVGYFLSSRRDLICAARTPPEALAHGHHSLELQRNWWNDTTCNWKTTHERLSQRGEQT